MSSQQWVGSVDIVVLLSPARAGMRTAPLHSGAKGILMPHGNEAGDCPERPGVGYGVSKSREYPLISD